MGQGAANNGWRQSTYVGVSKPQGGAYRPALSVTSGRGGSEANNGAGGREMVSFDPPAGLCRQYLEGCLAGQFQCVIHVDAQISDRIFDAFVTQQQLNRPEISGLAVKESRLGPAQRMGAI